MGHRDPPDAAHTDADEAGDLAPGVSRVSEHLNRVPLEHVDHPFPRCSGLQRVWDPKRSAPTVQMGSIPKEEIAAGRAHDRLAKDKYFNTETPTASDTMASARRSGEGRSEERIWHRLKKWWF